jgi:acyl carrier protein
MTAQRLTPDEVLGVVQAAVATVLEVPPAAVTRETRFRADLAADSLALLEILEILEQALAPRARPGFHLADEDLDGLASVGDAVDYAMARL